MKVGIQTIIWGPQIEDIEYVLDIIATAGYQGIEIAQLPDKLEIRNIDELLKLLDERNLVLIGLAGGTLQERIEFCGNVRPEYLYVENWDNCAPRAIESGFTLALHPHHFKPIHRLDEALRLLKEHPELRFLPDTAHLTIAGDDPIEAIQAVQADRLAGVYLKDWTPAFGRFSHRYARGFVELGKGIVKLDAFLKKLREVNYSGWAIVAQESTPTPTNSALKCAEWCAEKGLLSKTPQAVDRLPRTRVIPSQNQTRLQEIQVRFFQSMMRAGVEGSDSNYDTIAAAFAELVPCNLVTVWAYTPAQDLMSLLAIHPDPLPVALKTHVLKCSDVPSGKTISRKTVTHFDLTDEETVNQFGSPELLQIMELKKWVSIPILNPWNLNHVAMLVNLFLGDQELTVSDEELFHCGKYVAIVADAALTDLCSAAAARTNFLAARSKRSQDFFHALVRLIQESISCEGVSIFSVNDIGDKLVLAATTSIEWTVSERERFYRKGEGLTGWTWTRGEPFLMIDAKRELQK